MVDSTTEVREEIHQCYRGGKALTGELWDFGFDFAPEKHASLISLVLGTQDSGRSPKSLKMDRNQQTNTTTYL